MLPFLFLSLFAGAVVGDEPKCEVGPVNVNDFDFNQFRGPWVWLYHTNNYVEKDYGCLSDNFLHGPVSRSTTVAYNKVSKENETYEGFVDVYDNKSYLHDYDTDELDVIWKCTYFIMGIDYKEYVVLKGCLKGQDRPYTWIGFRNSEPTDEAIRNANKTLNAYDMTIEQLVKFSYCA